MFPASRPLCQTSPDSEAPPGTYVEWKWGKVSCFDSLNTAERRKKKKNPHRDRGADEPRIKSLEALTRDEDRPDAVLKWCFFLFLEDALLRDRAPLNADGIEDGGALQPPQRLHSLPQ